MQDNIDPVVAVIIAAILWAALAMRNKALVRAFFRDYLGFNKKQKEEPNDSHV